MTRPAAEAFAALEDAMTRILALEASITEDMDFDAIDAIVEKIDYEMDRAVGAWADLVVADVITDFAALSVPRRRRMRHELDHPQ